ncbi:hypothetical protein RHGRI_018643 [Rhododendron griersonianum]|uniref:Uncharacterized protein n=1 Tax=Rhododendron griersonianum TaxID=479676 RepID=A0AAV6K254_9ERIC|nr:hypothetical protein RHGRI_018643 [Rhododendron griersonianum]
MSLRNQPEEPKGKNVENDALGTPIKRKRVNAAKSGGKDEKSNTKSPEESLQIPKGKNVKNDVLRTHPKRKSINNKGAKPVGKDKHELVDSAGKRMSGNGKRFLCPQPQIPSSLTADYVAGKKMEYQVEHGKNTTRGEAMIGGPHRSCANVIESCANVIESSERIPSDGMSIANNGGNISTQSTTDISGLEVRTSKLERVFAQLKVERLGVKALTADNAAGKKMEYQVEHRKNTTRGEAIIGGSHRPCANVIESSDRIPSDGARIANNGGHISTQSTTDILLGLEVRTSKLEIVVAQLKAERLGIKSCYSIQMFSCLFFIFLNCCFWLEGGKEEPEKLRNLTLVSRAKVSDLSADTNDLASCTIPKSCGKVRLSPVSTNSSIKQKHDAKSPEIPSGIKQQIPSHSIDYDP